MKQTIRAALILCLLAALLLPVVSCSGSGQTEDTRHATDAVTDVPTEPGSETQAPDTDGMDTDTPDVPSEPETPVVTEPETEAETEPETDPVGLRLNDEILVKYVTPNAQCKAEMVEDKTEGLVLKLTTVDGAGFNDPNALLAYSVASRKLGGTTPTLEEYPFLMLKIKAEAVSTSLFELLWTSNKVPTLGSAVATAPFDDSDNGWQYLVFDMTSNEGWNGKLSNMRFDFLQTAVGPGESVSIAAVWFFPDKASVQKYLGMPANPFERETDPVKEAEVDKLLSVPAPLDEPENKKLTAANEDAGIDLWFNHSYTKTTREDVTFTGRYTYRMYMAKNEIEDCHLILAAAEGRQGLTVSVSDFRNAAGDTLVTDLMYAYYFEDVNGVTMPDPTPWVREGKTFDLEAGKSQLFIIKAHTAQNTADGLYEATVTVTDKDGCEVKKAVVSVYVWNFVLPEATTCKTQMALSWWNIYSAHKCYAGDGGLLYKLYYDYLLENRICSYDLPYNGVDGSPLFTDARVFEYLDNPRVVAFNPINFGKEPNASNVSAAYNALSQKPEWMEKAYFYCVDEPSDKSDLDRVLHAGNVLKEYFPGYKMLSPMHMNKIINQGKDDFFTYLKDVINVWCYKPFFYTTYEEYKYSQQAYPKPLTYLNTPRIEKTFGLFADRMAAEKAGGDELWWYVVHEPEEPEITLVMDTQAVRYRILFWQQKLYGVDHFLYYAVNDWWGLAEQAGLNSKHESYPWFDCYANGILVWCGAPFDEYGPVGSLRLECVRDGLEDFEYLTMLEQQYGEEMTELIIRRLTTCLSEYSTDEEVFTALRNAIGNLLDSNSRQ